MPKPTCMKVAKALGACSLIFSMAIFVCASSLQARITSSPAEHSDLATSNPTPLSAPVTMATRPFMMISVQVFYYLHSEQHATMQLGRQQALNRYRSLTTSSLNQADYFPLSVPEHNKNVTNNTYANAALTNCYVRNSDRILNYRLLYNSLLNIKTIRY